MGKNETNDKVNKAKLFFDNKFLPFHAVISGKISNFAQNFNTSDEKSHIIFTMDWSFAAHCCSTALLRV